MCVNHLTERNKEIMTKEYKIFLKDVVLFTMTTIIVSIIITNKEENL